MANRSFEERSTRSLTRTSAGSYLVTIPVEYIKELKWKSKQKLSVERTEEGIIIRELKK